MTRNNEKICTHPIASRTYKRKVIRSTTVKVEICGKCGRTLVKPEDAQLLLIEKGGENDPLNPSEVIITLLGTYPERPIINRIVMMKEVFLFEKEVARSIQLNIESLKFKPYDYGPYSKLIDDALRRLEEDGIIQIKKEAHGQKEIIELTDRGKDIAKKILENLSNEGIRILKRKRKAWDQLGYFGILQKVYDEYPAYRTKSKIKDKFKPTRRWT